MRLSYISTLRDGPLVLRSRRKRRLDGGLLRACEGIVEIGATSPIPSFPRKRESRDFSRLPPVQARGRLWTPAFEDVIQLDFLVGGCRKCWSDPVCDGNHSNIPGRVPTLSRHRPSQTVVNRQELSTNFWQGNWITSSQAGVQGCRRPAHLLDARLRGHDEKTCGYEWLGGDAVAG